MDRVISKCEFVSRYGGNIRVFISKNDEAKIYKKEEAFEIKFKNMNLFISKWKKEKLEELKFYFDKYGALYAKAFPGRAAILIKLLGLTEKQISAVYEIKGSIKTGFYVPGTRIPILPESELYKKRDHIPIINLAWHIPNAVRENLKNNKYSGKVIDII